MESKIELQKSAIAETCTRDLETYERALDVQWLNNRMENARVGRCLASIHKEAEMEKDSKERAEHAAEVNAEKEAALAIETAIVQNEEDYEQRSRLINKLEAGFVYRGSDEQTIHNDCSRQQENITVQEQHADYVLHEALLNDKDALQLQEAAKKEKCGQYRRDLEQQLVDRQQQKRCQYENTLIDKKRMDDIMRAISDEDKRDIQDKRDQTEKMHREMVTFQQTREDLRSKQKQQLVSDERRAKDQRAVGDDRSAALRTERQQEQRDISEANHKVVKQHIADEATRHERDVTTRQHQEQEYREKNIQYGIAEKKAFEKLKSDTNQAYNTHMDNKKRMGEEQKTRDAEYRKKNDALIAIDDEIDIEEEQQKKAENHLYALDLLEQMDDNRRRRQKEKQTDDDLGESVREWNKSWNREVTEERKKIEEDFPFLRSAANRHQD